MKKKQLFLLLTLLWILNAAIGGYFLYGDFAKMRTFTENPQMLSHVLYMAAAMIAAMLTFLQFWRHRNDD